MMLNDVKMEKEALHDEEKESKFWKKKGGVDEMMLEEGNGQGMASGRR